jgi:RimJ/RimL family protein N-acetyltransferase
VPAVEVKRDTLRRGAADFDRGVNYEYTLRELPTGELVGGVGVDRERGPTTAEIGYWVRSDRTRRGYATAGAGALIDAVFAGLPTIDAVEIRMDKGNVASAAIPPKLGFLLAGEETFDGPRTSAQTGQGWIWVLSREHWNDTGR